MERIKLFLHNHRTWVYNLQYILLSIFLLIIVAMVDLRILPIQPYLPGIFKMKVSLAKSILTTLAGAFLTITTFTFSTILTVLNSYASNFTPRVVENFIGMKITMKVLGVFIGGFFYCISALVFMRDFFEEQMVVAGFIAVIYSIICIIYFVIFVQEVIYKFQGVNLIREVSEEAEDVIAQEMNLRDNTPEYSYNENFGDIVVYSNASGYLSVLDIDRMLNLLKDEEGVFNIKTKIGEYVSEGVPLGNLNIRSNEMEEDRLEKLSGCFLMQDNKVSEENYQVGIVKILEIALCAMSTGVNDPNTAIHCIHKLGVLLQPLCRTNDYHIQKGEIDGCRIYYTSYTFKEDLGEVFMPLIHYGTDDLDITLALLDSLHLLMYSATEKNKESILDMVGYLKEKSENNFNTTLENEKFRASLLRFE